MSKDTNPYRVGTTAGSPVYDFTGNTAKVVDEAKHKPSHQPTEAWKALDILNLGKDENDINQHPDGDGCLDTGCN